MLKEASRKLSCDILVVGAGLAGLRAAYDCARAGLSVILAAKGKLCSGSSFYPLTGGLGSQLPLDEADKAQFLAELLDSGAGIADERLCGIMVDEIEGEVARLPELGIFPSPSGGRAACFAKRERRLMVWSGWEGIRKNAAEICSRLSGLTVLEYCDLLRITTRGGAVSGAVLVDSVSDILYAETSAIILATGGFCGLYRHCLNTDDVCGIGHSVALDAGAELINLEFMQFIPGLTSPVYKLLFGEVSLWHCDEVSDENGRPALREYLPPGVSFEDCLADRSMHGPFTSRDRSKYFDLAMMDQAIKTGSERGFTLHFRPEIAADPNGFVAHIRGLYGRNGIDLSRQTISVAPFAHCANGGVWIDEHGATRVPGLFSAGEVAGGIHGADRHGGAATSVCLVFGRRAAEGAVAYARKNRTLSESGGGALRELSEWIDTGVNSGVSPHDILHSLRSSLWYHANVLRNEGGLNPLLDWILSMRKEYNAARAISCGFDVKLSMQAFHALRTADSLIRSMLFRKESRGPHYRSDYPDSDPALFGRRVVVTGDGAALRYV